MIPTMSAEATLWAQRLKASRNEDDSGTVNEMRRVAVSEESSRDVTVYRFADGSILVRGTESTYLEWFSKESAELKMREAVAIVDALPIELPDVDLAGLARLAVEYRNALSDSKFDYVYEPGKEMSPNVQRWIFNYLRHGCSEYDWLLAEQEPWLADLLRRRIRARIRRAAASRWTELVSE